MELLLLIPCPSVISSEARKKMYTSEAPGVTEFSYIL